MMPVLVADSWYPVMSAKFNILPSSCRPNDKHVILMENVYRPYLIIL